MSGLLVALLMSVASLAWADPADDLKVCREKVGALTMQVQQAQHARTGYVAKLAEMLAETREQLDQAREQLQTVTQELARLRATQPEEKK